MYITFSLIIYLYYIYCFNVNVLLFYAFLFIYRKTLTFLTIYCKVNLMMLQGSTENMYCT